MESSSQFAIIHKLQKFIHSLLEVQRVNKSQTNKFVALFFLEGTKPADLLVKTDRCLEIDIMN